MGQSVDDVRGIDIQSLLRDGILKVRVKLATCRPCSGQLRSEPWCNWSSESLGILIHRSHCIHYTVGRISIGSKHLLLRRIQLLVLWEGVIMVYYGNRLIKSRNKCLLNSTYLASQFTIPAAYKAHGQTAWQRTWLGQS